MNRMYTRFTKKRSKYDVDMKVHMHVIKRKRIIGLFLEIKGLEIFYVLENRVSYMKE